MAFGNSIEHPFNNLSSEFISKITPDCSLEINGLGMKNIQHPIPRYANPNEMTSSPPPSVIPKFNTSISYASFVKPIVSKRSFELMHN